MGHASFLLETAAGTRIVTDPYAQDILAHPVEKAHVVTASHEHGDHCDVSQVKGDYVIVNTEKAVTFLDVKITCVPCFHDEVQGQKRGHNRAYVFEADGLRWSTWETWVKRPPRPSSMPVPARTSSSSPWAAPTP